MTRAEIFAYPRLHCGLHDLSGESGRSYGGVGFAVEAPQTRTTVTASSGRAKVSVPDADSVLEAKILDAIGRAEWLGLPVNASVDITQAAPSHVGLGKTTTCVLSALAGLNHCLEWGLPDEVLIDLSKRGRTSAIGANAFFGGGAIVADVGQRGHPGGGQYQPSLAPGDRPPSLLLGKWHAPADWRVWLAFTDLAPTFSEEDELAFFLGYSVTDRLESAKILQLAYHSLLPGFIDCDISAVARALEALHQLGFKQAEFLRQPEPVRQLLSAAWTLGVAAGLSSLGPTVYVIRDSDATLPDSLMRHADFLGPLRFTEGGHRVERGG